MSCAAGVKGLVSLHPGCVKDQMAHLFCESTPAAGSTSEFGVNYGFNHPGELHPSLSGASGEAAHVFGEPGVKVGRNQLPGFVWISRLGSPPLGPLGLDLTLYLPPGLRPQSRFVNLAAKQRLKLGSCSRS